MKVLYNDGTWSDIMSFRDLFECEAKDSAGRHFSGEAEVTVDLTQDRDLNYAFRNVYSTIASYDGDWGADFTGCVWSKLEAPMKYTKYQIVVGDECNDGHGRNEIVYVNVTASSADIYKASAAATTEFPRLSRLFTKYDDTSIPADLIDDLVAKGLPKECVSEHEDSFYIHTPEGLVTFFMEVLNLYMETPFEFSISEDVIPELSLPSSGYGLFS